MKQLLVACALIFVFFSCEDGSTNVSDAISNDQDIQKVEPPVSVSVPDLVPTLSSDVKIDLSESAPEPWSVPKKNKLTKKDNSNVYYIKTWRDLEFLNENFGTDEAPADANYKVTQNIRFPVLDDQDIPPLDEISEDSQYYTAYVLNGGFTPIGSEDTPFTGFFDGSDLTIEDVYISKPDENYVGFFGQVGALFVDTFIVNVRLKNAVVMGKGHVGGLIGYSNSTKIRIENNHVEGTISGTENYVGGIAGYLKRPEIMFRMNSTSGLVIGRAHVGGLIGYAKGGDALINDNHSKSSVEGSRSTIGGLIGTVIGGRTRIEGNTSSGNVFGKNNVGALIGRFGSNNGVVTKNYATGEVTGKNRTGGLIGRITPKKATIENNYSSGATSGTKNVGGLIGHVTGADNVLRHNYSSSSLSGTSLVGGLVGGVNDRITFVSEDNFWSRDMQAELIDGKIRPIYGVAAWSNNMGATPLTEENPDADTLLFESARFENWNADVWKLPSSNQPVFWPTFQ